MIYLTIFNTIAIAFLFYKKGKYYINLRKDTTFINNTVVGYHITLWKKTSEYSASSVYTLVIPIKNKKKVEKQEDIERMTKYSYQKKQQTLSAKFSWLKTWDEVEEFKKDYTIVDKNIVESLVANFSVKN